MKFTFEISEILNNYVYVFFDPRDEQPFYVGKGCGNRAFDHFSDQSESEKSRRIKEIEESGHEPRIEILRYGLSKSEASHIEAAVIDILGTDKLTNVYRGEHSKGFGRISTLDLTTLLKAKPVKISHSAILLNINKLYRSNMSTNELYEITRGVWKVGENRNKVEIAMAIYRGIVKEVYRINKWYPAGTLKYKTRDTSKFLDSGRWEFEGEEAIDIRDKYIDRSVRSYLAATNRNPIKYEFPNTAQLLGEATT